MRDVVSTHRRGKSTPTGTATLIPSHPPPKPRARPELFAGAGKAEGGLFKGRSSMDVDDMPSPVTVFEGITGHQSNGGL